MPALTVKTDGNVAVSSSSQRAGSPTRPPMSPITPPLNATKLPGDVPAPASATAAPAKPSTPSSSIPPRQTFSHTNHPAQPTTMLPPAPEPIDFSANPDVIALKSAIAVLQVQRQRATADIQALSRAKDDAVRDPEAFVQDLAAGNVNAPPPPTAYDDDDDDDDDSDNKTKKDEKSWSTLPKPQNIVRCPPINWTQYAVVGESLDKLHTEQVAMPSQGAPFLVNQAGAYEFQGGADGGQQQRAASYGGVAAPYAPGRDKIDRKPKLKK